MTLEASIHDSVQQMYEKTKADSMQTVADRYAEQEKVRCKAFCEKGLSCQMCSNGPCRIIPGKLEQGVCGIDGAGMVMRNMVHMDNMGIAAYTHHCVETAKTLKATALGKTPFSISDIGKLDMLCSALGVEGADVNSKAVALADRIIASLSDMDESSMVKAFAPAERQETWQKLGIFPAGPYVETMKTVARSMWTLMRSRAFPTTPCRAAWGASLRQER